MLQTMHHYGLLFVSSLSYLVTASIVLCSLWVMISHYWVFRRGGISGVINWHRNTINKYGFNDVRHSVGILALSAIGLILSNQKPSDFFTAFSILLSAFVFLLIAVIVDARRRHWNILKSSAREVIYQIHQ